MKHRLTRSLNTSVITLSLALLLPCLAAFADKRYIGANDAAWETASNWDPEGVPSIADNVFIPASKKVKIAVEATAASLTISNAAIVSVNGATSTVLDRNAADTNRLDSVGLTLGADLTLLGSGGLAIGGNNQLCPSSLIVGGDLALSGTARLAVYAGAINGTTITFQTGGARVSVAGETRLGTGTWIYPYCHVLPATQQSTGAPVVFDLQDVTISAGAGFNADERGYTRYSTCPGYANSGASYIGGSYGGRGGNSAATGLSSLNPYGYANAPFYPGGAGGNSGAGMQGGGAIRIIAQSMALNGTLTANGRNSTSQGGSAGGGIWLTCQSLTVGSNAWISAKGGAGTSTTSGGGGGGRVAIGIGLTTGQIDALYATGEATGLAITPLGIVLQDRITVAGNVAGGTGTAGQDGTAVYYINRAGANLLQIDGIPETYLSSTTPKYGPYAISDGSNVAFSAISPTFVSDDLRSRRISGGYTITNTTDDVIATSTALSGTITVNEDLFLTWDWTQLEHTIELSVNGNGSITTNTISRPDDLWQPANSTISVTAVPAAGNVFLIWDGEITGAQRTNTTITLTHDQARSITAVFASSATGNKLWTAGADGINWLDGANWTPAGVPGPNETVQILNGTCVQDGRMIAKISSLEIGSDAFLKVSGSGTTVTGQAPTDTEQTDPVGLIITGDCLIEGKVSIGGQDQMCRSVLNVAGDLTLSGSAAQLAVYAGYDVPLALATYQQGGAAVIVGGDITVADGCWIYPVCDAISGAPVIFEAERVTVAAGGGFNADSRGWRWISIRGVIYHYGPGSDYGNHYAGGGYGGMGGRGTSHIPYGITYGYAAAPFMPGSPGGNNLGENKGGGAIRIHARSVNLYGTLTANGSQAVKHSGGGSGGGIWVTCRFLRTGPETKLSVVGGKHLHTTGGSGGGGRIALTVGLTDDQIDECYTSGSASGTYTVFDLEEGEQTQYIQGTVNIAGGTTTAPAPATVGEPGTAVFVSGPPSGTLITIR